MRRDCTKVSSEVPFMTTHCSPCSSAERGDYRTRSERVDTEDSVYNAGSMDLHVDVYSISLQS